jgi:hypothetical protein
MRLVDILLRQTSFEACMDLTEESMSPTKSVERDSRSIWG